MNTPYDQWLEMNRAAMGPIMRWSELVTGTAEKVARQGLTLAKDYVELGSRQLQLMTEIREPQKWALEESRLVSEFGQKLVSRAEDCLQVAKETRDAWASWTETTAKEAGEWVAPKAQ